MEKRFKSERANAVFISQKYEAVTEFEMPMKLDKSELRVVRAFQEDCLLDKMKKAVVKGLQKMSRLSEVAKFVKESFDTDTDIDDDKKWCCHIFLAGKMSGYTFYNSKRECLLEFERNNQMFIVWAGQLA